MYVLFALTFGVITIRPACVASVNVTSESASVTGAVNALKKSPTVSFLLIGVPLGSSIICNKSSLAEAAAREVNAVIFRSAIIGLLLCY